MIPMTEKRDLRLPSRKQVKVYRMIRNSSGQDLATKGSKTLVRKKVKGLCMQSSFYKDCTQKELNTCDGKRSSI